MVVSISSGSSSGHLRPQAQDHRDRGGLVLHEARRARVSGQRRPYSRPQLQGRSPDPEARENPALTNEELDQKIDEIWRSLATNSGCRRFWSDRQKQILAKIVASENERFPLKERKRGYGIEICRKMLTTVINQEEKATPELKARMVQRLEKLERYTDSQVFKQIYESTSRRIIHCFQTDRPTERKGLQVDRLVSAEKKSNSKDLQSVIENLVAEYFAMFSETNSRGIRWYDWKGSLKEDFEGAVVDSFQSITCCGKPSLFPTATLIYNRLLRRIIARQTATAESLKEKLISYIHKNPPKSYRRLPGFTTTERHWKYLYTSNNDEIKRLVFDKVFRKRTQEDQDWFLRMWWGIESPRSQQMEEGEEQHDVLEVDHSVDNLSAHDEVSEGEVESTESAAVLPQPATRLLDSTQNDIDAGDHCPLRVFDAETMANAETMAFYATALFGIDPITINERDEL